MFSQSDPNSNQQNSSPISSQYVGPTPSYLYSNSPLQQQLPKPGAEYLKYRSRTAIVAVASFAIVGLFMIGIGYGNMKSMLRSVTDSYSESQVLGASTIVDNNKYQAIFLLNNSVYFGHVESKNANELILQDTYFLQVSDSTQKIDENTDAKTQPELSIIRRTDALHGPDGRMVIPMNNVLYIETLTDNSKVVEAIEGLKNQQNNNSTPPSN